MDRQAIFERQVGLLYLPQSVEAFPSRKAFLNKLKKVGFKKVEYKSLTFGVAILYIASK